MAKTTISWTDYSWNPIIARDLETGKRGFFCVHVSDGCRNCYSAAINQRLGTGHDFTAPNLKKVEILLNTEPTQSGLDWPYRAKRPRRIFIVDMTDLFGEFVPDEFIAKIFKVMNDNRRHTFQVLTKRPERAAKWPGPWTENIWMGVSVEDAKNAHRIATLRTCPAQIKFISYEPGLDSLGAVDLTGYRWLIVGGESGVKDYRKLDMAWAREARDLCLRYGLAFFFKQDSAFKNETRPWLVEEDGSCWEWHQWPDEMREPRKIEGVAAAHSEIVLNSEIFSSEALK